MAGYHKKKIPKGVLGNWSKIEEEFLEAKDSHEQKNEIMTLLELSDLLGAIEAYCSQYNIDLKSLIKMKDATKSAFLSGHR